MKRRSLLKRLLARPAGRYAQVPVLIGAAFALRLALTPWLGTRGGLILCYPAVLAAAWIGGVGPGVFAVGTSLLGFVLLLRPRGPFTVNSPEEWFGVGLYTITAIAIAVAGGAGRRARNAISQEMERTRDILDQMSVGFVVVDRDYRFVFLNAAALAQTGKRYEDVIGRDARLMFGEAREAMAAIGGVLDRGEAREYELHYAPTGRWSLQRAFPVREGAAVFVMDITDRKRADAEVRQSRAQLTRTLEAGRMGHWSWNVETGDVAWSENLEAIHGVPSGAFGGTFDSFLALVHPDDRAGIQERIAVALREGSHYEIEYRVQRPDGRIEWVAGRGEVELRDGKPVRMSGLASNVTDLKRSEGERRLLAAIVSSSEDAIVSKALDGTITSWNRAAERMFGYTADEAVGQSIRLIMPPEKQDDFLGILEQIRRGERVEHYETLRRTRDGRIIEVALTVSPVHDETGRIVGASKIARDITASKAEERERQRTRDMYLGILGHDLRNPLNTIVASLYTLEKQVPEEARKVLPRMARSTQRMSRMIEQLLDFTRARLGDGITLNPSPGDLRDISHAVVEEIEAQHPQRIRFQADSVPGRFDSDRLAQAVANLVGNALQHGSPASSVDVRVTSRNGSGRLEVSNRGTPIPESVRATIFEPFRRAEGRRDSGGLGLGLYIANEIVRAHGGTIRLESADDLTTFAIELPTAGVPSPAQK
ncbi:MAG TPA: PAS domain S-box protein [Thermoanaerobaculia bacterium]|nr:PAS domain S-box protein [Thermoanaerobaculia bacterium]